MSRVYCVFEVINDPEYGGNHMRLEAIYQLYKDAVAHAKELNKLKPQGMFIFQCWNVD